MFQWRSARRTSGEKEGTWQEKVPSSAGRGGEEDCISSASGLCDQCFTTPAHLPLGGPPDNNTVPSEEGILAVIYR